MSTMKSQIIPSGRARSPARTGITTFVVLFTVVLAVLALLGVNIVALALLALVVLGSTLILFDTSLKIEPHEIVQ
jgi:hypothetical protein